MTAPDLLSKILVWSPGRPKVADLYGLPTLPCVQAGSTAAVVGSSAPLVWAWTAPGDCAALNRYGSRLIADVELASWRGRDGEVEHAEVLARTCPAVTSHGFVMKRLRASLKPFAAAGRVAIPQVYDGDQSTAKTRGGPAAFLRRCVAMYRDAGFERVVPLLGTNAGLPILRVWVDTCNEMGVPFHLWAYGQIIESAELRRWVRSLARDPVELPPAVA